MYFFRMVSPLIPCSSSSGFEESLRHGNANTNKGTVWWSLYKSTQHNVFSTDRVAFQESFKADVAEPIGKARCGRGPCLVIFGMAFLLHYFVESLYEMFLKAGVLRPNKEEGKTKRENHRKPIIIVQSLFLWNSSNCFRAVSSRLQKK